MGVFALVQSKHRTRATLPELYGKKLSKALGFTGISENRLCYCSLVQASLKQAFKISFSRRVLEKDGGP